MNNEKNTPEAEIEVENITARFCYCQPKMTRNGHPSTCVTKIVSRLNNNNYKYYYEHLSFDGGHYIVKKHFDKVFEFAENHFK